MIVKKSQDFLPLIPSQNENLLKIQENRNTIKKSQPRSYKPLCSLTAQKQKTNKSKKYIGDKDSELSVQTENKNTTQKFRHHPSCKLHKNERNQVPNV